MADTTTDEVDTSTNEDTQDTGVELEDIEVTPEELADDETEETKDTESEETDTEPSEEEESKEDEAEGEESEAKLSDEDKQKQHNREMAEKRIQDKQAREEKIKADQQAYLAEADSEDPRDTAVRQLQIDAYNNKVEGNTNKLTNGYEKAIADFEVLRDATPEIQAEIDAAIHAFQAINVSLDAYGNPVEVRGDLYKHLQSKADSISRLTGIGARQQSKSKDKEKSKTFTPPSKAPKEPKVDPDLAAFDEEAKK